jgi:hypothetical protein
MRTRIVGVAGAQSTARLNCARGAPCTPVCEIVVRGHGVSPLHFDGTISTSMQRDANTSIDVRLRDSGLVY